MTSQRATISYCISGVAAREQIVFKSLMRLLGPRLAHAWVYMPQGELAVVGDPPNLAAGQTPQAHHLTIDQAQSLLTVGTEKNNGMHYLRLPIQANVMEVQLNALGSEITAARLTGLRQASNVQSRQTMETQPQALPMAEPLASELPLNASFVGTVSLKRWPSQHLVRSAAQIRMATILLRPKTTMKDFLALSGQPPENCLQFLHELRTFEFLRVEQHETSALRASALEPAALTLAPLAQAAMSPGTSLLSRIRKRLGL
ncbi:MAG: hypothetical protein EAZ37_07265 [Burkholderiales bacterium]|nr:MAG: hypothetical protein EAZ37_07265 [Burkholderiales bacterium]